MTAITHSCEYGRITPVRVDTRVLGVPGLLRGVRHRYAPVSFPRAQNFYSFRSSSRMLTSTFAHLDLPFL